MTLKFWTLITDHALDIVYFKIFKLIFLSQRISYSSCTNLDKIPKSPALDNSILQDQTNLEILNIEKLRRKQQACLLEASHMLRQRSQSAMNEPYSNTNNQQANNKNPAFNTSSFSSSPNSSVSSISMFQKPNTKHHITVLDSCSTLSRNKSVSANNINESHNNVINYNGNEDNFMPSNLSKITFNF